MKLHSKKSLTIPDETHSYQLCYPLIMNMEPVEFM